MNYVLLFCGTQADQDAFNDLSPEELGARFGEVGQWFAEHQAEIRDSNQLQPRDTAMTGTPATRAAHQPAKSGL